MVDMSASEGLAAGGSVVEVELAALDGAGRAAT